MKNILTVLILLILPVTSVYAVKSLNAELNGVYDDHSNWQCIGGPAPLGSSADFSLETLTTTGVITYNGDGTAQSEGRVALTRATTPPFGDIADYACEWTYEVFEDRTFTREGECDVVSRFTEQESVATNQIWFGKIKGKGAKR